MPVEMIDFGKFAQTAIAFQNLQETIRRNDLGAQGLTLEQGRLEAQREQNKIEQQKAIQGHFKNLLELANDPRVKSNPSLSDQVLSEAGRVAGIPQFSPETIQRGRDYQRNMLDAMANGTPEAAHDAFIELQVLAGPKDAETMVKSVGEFQKVREYSANVEAMRQAQAARFEKVQSTMSKVNVWAVPLSDAVRDFTVALDKTDTLEFKGAMKESEKLPTVKERDERAWASLIAIGREATVQEFAKPRMDGLVRMATGKAAQFVEQIGRDRQLLALAQAGEPLPPGVSKRDLIERITLSQTMVDSYSDLSEWARTPFDPQAVQKAQAARDLIVSQKKQLDNAKSHAQEEIVAIRKEAQAHAFDKDAKKAEHEKQVGLAQAEILEKYGYTPQAGQIAEVALKHQVSPSEILPGLADPAKKGKLEVDLLAPTPAVRTDLQNEVRGLDSLLDTTAQLRSIVTAHPEAVGVTGNIIRFMGGLGQQTQAASMALFQADKNMTPEARRQMMAKFSTKPEDDLEAYSIGLTYRMARVISGTGVLSDKDIAEAERLVSPLKSMRGADQFLNHLNVIEHEAYSKAHAASKILQSGQVPKVSDQGPPSVEQAPSSGALDFMRKYQQRGNP